MQEENVDVERDFIRWFVAQVTMAIGDRYWTTALGPELVRYWSDMERRRVRLSDTKFDAIVGELQRADLLSTQDEINWRERFVPYQVWRDQRFQRRRTGSLAGSMRPERAEGLIEARLEAMGITLVHLREPTSLRELVDIHVLERCHHGDYGGGTATGQALAVMLQSPSIYFGPLSDERLQWMRGYAHFQLAFNGLHSGSLDTLRFAQRGLANADRMGEDRTVLAMRLHIDNLIAEREGRSPDTQLAVSALDLRSTGGGLPLLPNVERAIRRRDTLEHVHEGKPLSFKPDNDKTLESLLIGYRDEADRIGAKSSLVVDNIGLTEVMLQHDRLRDAHAFHSEAKLAFEDAPTPANERLMQRALQQLRIADAATKLKHRN